MNLEHSGGVPNVGFITVNDCSQEAELTSIVEWDPRTLDKLSDILDETGDAKEILVRLLRREAKEFTARTLLRIFALIGDAPNPALAIDQVRWTCGIALLENQTVSWLARKHHITKQAFQQGAERFRSLLDIRSQSRRSDAKRENMKKAYAMRVIVKGIKKKRKPHHPNGPSPLRWAISLALWMHRQDFSAQNQDWKKAWKRELEPIVEIYERL